MTAKAARKSPKAARPAPREGREDALYAALAELKSPAEIRRFLADLCTPGEIAAFGERWEIARMLDQGGTGYREIAGATGASTTTVTRVARFLMQERHQGYKLVLNRQSKK